MTESQKFTVPVTFKFEGTVEVQASTREKAQSIVESSFGLTLNSGLHTSDNRIADWTFDGHPEKHVAIAVQADHQSGV